MNVIRVIKSWMVLQVGAFAALVAVNNVIDYGSNFAFVQHVLSMDTTFEGNKLMWRAVTSPFLHHSFYSMIILFEFLCGVICIYSAYLLFKTRDSSLDFYKAKQLAAFGITIGITLWFSGFMTVGAEWFLMWQSETWNGQAAASRFIAMLFFVLIFLFVPEESGIAEGS